MIFTESKDGVDRANVHVRLRLDREEWASILKLARIRRCPPHQVLEAESGLAVENLIDLINNGECDQ